MSASLESSNVDDQAVGSLLDAGNTSEQDHFVLFYDSDSYLTELHITKALVESQGGSISATSELGAGSTFSYTVPAANRRSAD